MDLIHLNDGPYVKLEVDFDLRYSAVEVYFNVKLHNYGRDLIHGVWDAEVRPRVNRNSETETELLKAILDCLTTDHFVDLDHGLLESIEVSSVSIFIGLNERGEDFSEKSEAVGQEVKATIEKAIANFSTLKV